MQAATDVEFVIRNLPVDGAVPRDRGDGCARRVGSLVSSSVTSRDIAHRAPSLSPAGAIRPCISARTSSSPINRRARAGEAGPGLAGPGPTA